MTRPRPAFLAGLAATWIAAAAIVTAPSTSAVAGASSRTVDASAFAPVTVQRVLTAPAAGDRSSRTGSAAAGPIVEPAASTETPSRPAVRVPSVTARSVVKLPKTTHALSGRASWYCRAGVSICMSAHPDVAGADLYAAAGPKLRRAICGSDTSDCWRGRRVVVDGIVVVLADWCQCSKGKATEKIIDLYWDAWTRIPGAGDGVTVRW